MPKPSGRSATAVVVIRKTCLNNPYSFWLSVRVSKTGIAKANMNASVLARRSQKAWAVSDLRGGCWSIIQDQRNAEKCWISKDLHGFCRSYFAPVVDPPKHTGRDSQRQTDEHEFPTALVIPSFAE